MKVEEIANKYVYGNHDALTDSQEVKDMVEDINNHSKELLMKYTLHYLENRGTDFEMSIENFINEFLEIIENENNSK